MTEIQRFLFERHPRNERREHEYHQDTVRLVLLRMDPTDIASQMLPPTPELEQLLATQPELSRAKLEQIVLQEASSPLPELTSTIWEVKGSGRNVVNPNQVILVGGGGRKHDPTNPISTKDIIRAARAEAFEEVHLVAHQPRVVEGISYTYSFDHPRVPNAKGKRKPGRLKNTTFLVTAGAAPHDRVQFYDPQDKLQSVLQLKPSHVSRLLSQESIETETGKAFSLVDSLSVQSERRRAARVEGLPEEANIFRQAIEKEAYIYEAQTLKRVISYLPRVPDNQLKDQRKSHIARFASLPAPTTKDEAIEQLARARVVLKDIEHSYPDKTKHPILYVDPGIFHRLSQKGVSEHRLKARMKLIQDISLAAKWVSEDITVEYYKDTGPQFPLLLANMMARKPGWGKHDYELISHSAELKHIVDTVCRVFGVNPRHEGWYAKITDRLRTFRLSERTAPSLYRQNSAQLKHLFCNPAAETGVHRIGDPGKLGKLSERVENFLKQQFMPLSRKVDPEILTSMRHDSLGSTTQEIGELVLRMFGMNQYSGEEISISERNAAMRKMLEMIRIDRVDVQVNTKANTHIRPLRSAMDTILGPRIGTLKTSAGTFDYHRIPVGKINMFKNLITIRDTTAHGINFSTFAIPLAFSVRVKDEYSSYRKDLERGGLEDPNEDMSDIFGFMMGLDVHQFEQELLERHPSTPPYAVNEIVRLWQRWASQLVLNAIMMQVDADNAPHETNFRLYKGRVSATMDDLLYIEDQQKGSASSDAKWEWIKYVMEMHDDTEAMFQVEIQHFPSIEDLVKKKIDDDRFHLERLFDHAPGRYPLIRVLFDMQDTYGDVMHAYYDRRNRQREFNLVWWKRLRLAVHYWLRNMTEEDAALSADDA